MMSIILIAFVFLSTALAPGVKAQPFPVAADTSVLILSAASSETKIDALSNIIHSRWGGDVTRRDLLEYEPGDALAFGTVLVVDELGLALSGALRADLPAIARTGLIWVGSGLDRLERVLTGSATSFIETGQPEPLSLEYRGVKIPGNLLLTHDLTTLSRQTGAQVLATGLDADDTRFPVMLQIAGDWNVLAIALPTVPDWYQSDGISYVVLDTLHAILGPAQGTARQNLALIRLEDVNAETYYDPTRLTQAFDLLADRGVPFHIAVIPEYVDHERGILRGVSEARRFSYALRQAVETSKATLVQHGYSHQVNTEVSGIGFEFWDARNNRPLKNDSRERVLDLITAARAEMAAAGLPVPDIWETPHYAYSALDNEVFNEVYPFRYEPALRIGSLPFPLSAGGAIHIPETLGYIEKAPDIDQIAQRLRLLSVLEKPVVASVFWHPWRPLEELDQLVSMIEGAGFRFVSAHEMVNALQPEWARPSEAGYKLINWLTGFCLAVFIVGSVSHFFRRIILARNVRRSLNATAPTVAQLRAAHPCRDLPRFAIMVPAREETRVIRNTIDSLIRLDYPAEWLNVVIITDGRETPDPEIGQTTFDIARARAAQIAAETGLARVQVVSVPDWYSGVLGSLAQTHARSTKGRALNYALQWLQDQPGLCDVDYIGVVDADGRLHANVLREAAGQILANGARLLQGPVLQISNFPNVTLIGKLAGLELANYHFTNLAEGRWFSRYPKFLAGTNYFVDRTAIVDAGGWDQTALVEDADLAVRLFQRDGVRLSWLWSCEIEQTAPNFSIYKRQRERWVRGHLALAGPIWRSRIAADAKAFLMFKIISSQFRFLFDLTFPVLAALIFFGGYVADAGPALRWISIVLLIGAVLIWDSYGFIYRQVSRLDPSGAMRPKRMVSSLAFYLLFLPYIIVQAIPRLQAVWNLSTRRSMDWYKTERTHEQ